MNLRCDKTTDGFASTCNGCHAGTELRMMLYNHDLYIYLFKPEPKHSKLQNLEPTQRLSVDEYTYRFIIPALGKLCVTCFNAGI